MSAAHVWRIGQVTDCREAGDLVLIQRGDERLWLDDSVAVAVGAVAHRIRDRAAREVESRDGWSIWSVGWEAWLVCALVALAAVCAAMATR